MIEEILIGEKSQGVPAGIYQGVFTDIEGVEANAEKDYGAAYRFIFTVTEGPYAGSRASRIVSKPKTVASASNALGKFIMAMSGQPLTPNSKFLPKEYVGKAYTIVVTATESGGTRVETVQPR